jgi:signal transduction histidine kinase
VAEQQDFKEVNATLLGPIAGFVQATQAERSEAGRYLAVNELGAPAQTEADALTDAGEATDLAVTALQAGIDRGSTEAAGLDPRLPGRIAALIEAANNVAGLRADVLAGAVKWDEAYDAYTMAIDHASHVHGPLGGVQVPDTASDPRVVHELAMAREMFARADAIMAGVFAARTMTDSQHSAFAGSVRAGDALLMAVRDLHPDDEAAYRAVLESDAYGALRDYDAEVTSAGAGDAAAATISADDWSSAVSVVLDDLAAAEAGATTIAAEESSLLGLDVLGASGLAVALGLVGVILSLLISVQIGRGLLVELVGLRNSAMDLAARKLPAALRRLHAGEPVDLEREAPRAVHGDDEVSQVAEALNAVHRAAIRSAIERSEVLSGVSGVYVYLARRSQVLLHRQLALLDSMERRTENPEDLEDLFRLDHLTTRMRRQAESLIILSGSHPARRWRYPVPVVDVVRAAVAEVEDFTRVEVHDLPDIRLVGSAVADLTHLIAELVENAVTFSPPHTKALVRGDMVGSGLAIEVEDRGLGMSGQAMEDANARIQDVEQVDLLEADQLGLFVVNRLAHRQEVKVTLQRSPYGGVTAIVLIPDDLLDKTSSDGEVEPSTQPGMQLAASPSLTVVPSPGLPGPSRFMAAMSASSRARSSGPSRESPWRVITLAPEDGTDRVEDSSAAADQDATEAESRDSEVSDPEVGDPERTGPQPGDPPPIGPRPDDLVHADSAGDRGAPGGDGGELPRRVRQANLAPQLREGPAPPPNPPADPAGGRTPEQARATLSALRTGWLRGQREGDDDSVQGGAQE